MTDDDNGHGSPPVIENVVDAAARGDAMACFILEGLRAAVATGAGHECHEWIRDGACALCDRPVSPS